MDKIDSKCKKGNIGEIGKVYKTSKIVRTGEVK
jgi:hypothetical protein